MRRQNKTLATATSVVGTALVGLASGAAHATVLPATFTDSVKVFGNQKCPSSSSAPDGYCIYTPGPPASVTTTPPIPTGASFAHTDGGVLGNPGYDATLGPGTHVAAGATGLDVASKASMTYYFEVGYVGNTWVPAGPDWVGGQIAVDIISSGDAFVSGGNGISSASMIISEMGPDTDIMKGQPDPDKLSILDVRTDTISCFNESCSQLTGSNWGSIDQPLSDHLCLTQGDMYAITITASSSMFSAGGSGGASVDPNVIVDPQGPTDPKAHCYQPTNPVPYQDAISISGGTSTGFIAIPEPGALGLLGLGLAAVGLRQAAGRRRRQTA